MDLFIPASPVYPDDEIKLPQEEDPSLWETDDEEVAAADENKEPTTRPLTPPAEVLAMLENEMPVGPADVQAIREFMQGFFEGAGAAVEEEEEEEVPATPPPPEEKGFTTPLHHHFLHPPAEDGRAVIPHPPPGEQVVPQRRRRVPRRRVRRAVRSRSPSPSLSPPPRMRRTIRFPSRSPSPARDTQ